MSDARSAAEATCDYPLCDQPARTFVLWRTFTTIGGKVVTSAPPEGLTDSMKLCVEHEHVVSPGASS